MIDELRIAARLNVYCQNLKIDDGSRLYLKGTTFRSRVLEFRRVVVPTCGVTAAVPLAEHHDLRVPCSALGHSACALLPPELRSLSPLLNGLQKFRMLLSRPNSAYYACSQTYQMP